MVLTIFILVVLQVWGGFNRPHLPHLPDPKGEDNYMEGGTDNDEPAPSPGKSNICIAWEIIHRLFGAALVDFPDSYILLESDGNMRIQYVVSDPDPYFGDGT